MGPRLRRVLIAVGTVAIVVGIGSAVPGAGQAPGSYKAPRTPDGQPDLSGVWQAVNTANWDLEEHGVQAAPYHQLLGTYLAQPAGRSVVEGGTIPYKPEALAKRKRHLEQRLTPDPLLLEDGLQDLSDPEAKCFAGGIPRATYMPFPFQIIQTKNKVLFAYQFAGAARVVHLDMPRSELLDINTWMGTSVGRWEGDTLVVEASWFSGTVWLDRAGNFYESDSTVVMERFTPSSPNHVMYEATIEDPAVFTRPWKIRMPLYRRMEPNAELLEFQCAPLVEEYRYGKLKRPTAK